jgi:hypothetical protein
MTHLQWALLALGLAVVLGVWLYNRWSARRLMPKRSEPAPPRTESQEPQLEAGDSILSSTTPVDRELDEANLPEGPRSALPLGAGRALAVLCDELDVAVDLTLDHVVSGEAVLAALPSSRRVGTKPFVVEGRQVNDDTWEFPRAGQRYAALRAGAQRANRSGALNEIEYSEFVVKVQAFADALSAEVDFPDMMNEVALARELDQFASDHDAQLTFTVRALRVAWSPGYLTQHAAQQGFVAGALPGRMVLPASQSGGAPILVLQYETQLALAEDPEQGALREFHLTLDVPQVARSERPFVRMRGVAQALAQSMEGAVTDGGLQTLDSDALDAIGADLERLYDALEARALPAGSLAARRLFS